ncbi:MAG: hypothetical protein K2M91_01540 [Lachnospiraceae bacterium]|nr:hypothetical protein [Lachnospiraceae bacterium]
MKRKCMKLAGIVTLMMTLSVGCSIGQEAGNQTSESLPFNDSQENVDNPTDISQNNNDEQTDISQNNNSTITTDNLPEINNTEQDTIYIGGKVRSVSQDCFVISRTLVEDSMVTMPEAGSPDEVLVTIWYSDSTAFEHWTIQGGGGDIVKEDAAFSDIKVGDGLEALGYFHGDEFIAEKIIIELYQ